MTPRARKLRVEGAFWGRGKCPECGRRYQKDLRVILAWDKAGKNLRFLRKLCTWCLIILFAEAVKIDPTFTIHWATTKKEALEGDRILRAQIKAGLC